MQKDVALVVGLCILIFVRQTREDSFALSIQMTLDYTILDYTILDYTITDARDYIKRNKMSPTQTKKTDPNQTRQKFKHTSSMHDKPQEAEISTATIDGRVNKLEYKKQNHEKYPSEEEKILKWLKQFGFSYNPFHHTNSERDRNLDEHFIEYPDFDKMLELNDQVLFARTGDGKTASRLRLQTYYRDALADQRVFAFSYLVSQELADDPPENLEGHLEEILKSAVSHVFVFIALRGSELPSFQDEELASEIAQQFALFFEEYYGVKYSWAYDLERAIEEHSLRQAIKNLGPVYDDLESFEGAGRVKTEWAKRWLSLLTTDTTANPVKKLSVDPMDRWHIFCQLIYRTGIEQILLLVDGVDVKPTQDVVKTNHSQSFTRPNKESIRSLDYMERITHPLLRAIIDKSLGVNVTWKLFLPLDLYLSISLLSTEIPHAILSWDEERLGQLLEFRLSAATQGTINTLLQIADDDVPEDLETYLIICSNLSPRYLIHNINEILSKHINCASSESLPGKLSGRSLQEIAYSPHLPL